MAGFEIERERDIGLGESSSSSRWNLNEPLSNEVKGEKPSANILTDKVLLREALLLIDKGSYSEARKKLIKLLSRNSEKTEAIRWLGYCFKQMGDLQSAQKCLTKLCELERTHESFAELGHLNYELDNKQEALECYHQSLLMTHEGSPMLFEIHKNLGNLYISEGDLEGARENYDKAFGLYSNSDVLQVNYGTLEMQTQSWDKAIVHFTRAIVINKLNDNAWMGLALVYRFRGDNELAWGNLKKALDINCNNLTAINRCVKWGFEDDRFSEAREYLSKYLDNYPEDLDISFSYAGILFASGFYKESLLELEKIHLMDPSRKDANDLIEVVTKELNI